MKISNPKITIGWHNTMPYFSCFCIQLLLLFPLVAQERNEIEALSEKAKTLSNSAEYLLSNDVYQQLIDLKVQYGWCGTMEEHLAIANNLFDTPKVDESLQAVDNWLKLFSQNKCDTYKEKVNAFFLKYRIYASLKQRKISELSLDSAYVIINNELGEMTPEMGYVHQYYAVHYGAIGANYLAVHHAEKSFDIRMRLYDDDHDLFSHGLYSLANYSERIGDYDRSHECLNTIIKSKAGGDEVLLSRAYHLLSLVCIRMGDFATAEKYGKLALNRFNEQFGIGSRNSSFAYNELGSAYKGLGQYQKSKESLTEAYKIRNRLLGPYHRLTLSSLTQLTHVRFAQGDTLGAIKEFKKIVNDYIVEYEIDQSDKYVLSMIELGDLYERANMPDSALLYYHQANEIAEEYYEEGDRPHVKSNHKLSSTVPRSERLAYSKSALYHLTQDSSFYALDQHSIPFIQDRFSVLRVYARHAKNLYGQYLQSQNSEYLEELIALQPQFQIIKNETFRQFLSPRSIVQSAPRIREVAFLQLKANEILYKETGEASYLNGALHAMEESKNLVLQVQLFERNLKHILSIPDSILNQERVLFSKINLLKQEKEEGQSDSLKNELVNLEKAYFDLRRNTLMSSDKYRRITQENEVNISDLQGGMAKDEMILNYFLDDNELFILSVTSTELGILRRDFNEGHKQELESYLNFVKAIPKEGQEHMWGIGHELFLRLLPESIPAHIRKLKIIPDNNLYILPFDVLLSEDPSGNQEFSEYPFLIQDYEISYLSGLRHGQKQMKTSVSDEVLAFAPFSADLDSSPIFLPLLQYSEHELDQISEIFRVEKYTGRSATEDVFKSQSSRYEIIHIASHAVVDGSTPLNSNILFFPSDTTGEDGRLALWELYAMDVPARLAVLSACQTSDGQAIKGAGITNIARGFYTAGTSDVISNLWPVQDYAASELMKSFYSNLKSSTSPSYSLRAAKLDYLNAQTGLLAHPMYWAGWMLQSSEVSQSANTIYLRSYWPIAMIILFALPFLFLLRFRRK